MCPDLDAAEDVEVVDLPMLDDAAGPQLNGPA